MKKTNLLLTFFVIVAIASCDNSKTENQFTLLSSNDTGVDFINKLYEDNQINYFTYPYIYMGGGVSVGDINNDEITFSISGADEEFVEIDSDDGEVRLINSPDFETKPQ